MRGTLLVAVAMLFAGCGKAASTLQCLPCTSDSECTAPAFCSRGYCVKNGEDPRRCPQQETTGASGGGSTGASSSSTTSSTSSASSSSTASSTGSASSATTSASSSSSGSATASGSSSSGASSGSSAGSSSSGSSASASSSAGASSSSGSSTATSASSTSGSGTTSSGSSSTGSTGLITTGSTGLISSGSGSTGSGSTSTTGSGSTGSTGTGSTGSTGTGSTSSTGSTGSSGTTTGGLLCLDLTQDGNETDVDCGGADTCPRCGTAKKCLVDSDCVSGTCLSDRCACNGTVTSVMGAAGSSLDVFYSALVGTPTSPQMTFDIGSTSDTWFSECDGGCASATPTFHSGDLTPTNLGTLYGTSLAELPSGGVGLAVNFGNLLYYGECTSDCTAYASWTFHAIPVSVQNNTIPGLAVLGNVRAFTIASGGGLTYLECTSGCSQAGATWNSVQASPNNLNTQAEAGLAMSLVPFPDGGSTVLHHIVYNSSYLFCAGANCAINNTWTRVNCPGGNCPNAKGDTEVRLDSQDLPHYAGNDGCSRIYVGRCKAEPCTTSSNWTQTVQAASDSECPGALPSKLSLQLDANDRGHVAYVSTTGLAMLDELADGGWSKRLLTTCEGAALTSVEAPSLLLTSQGSPRVAFGLTADAGLPDGGHVPPGPAWYLSGP